MSVAGERRFRTAHISEVPTLASDLVEAEWKPVRFQFGITGFGANGYVGRSKGELVIEEHADGEHEELYVVLGGTARFTVDGETFDARSGTLVFVPVGVERGAWAADPDTAILAIGAPPGTVPTSGWEKKRLPT
ncbi:MAG: cupin domain-containing protein [Actinobacteria bacterium]|nr:cupin domain-containing protein [Actinomycetota bacterium]